MKKTVGFIGGGRVTKILLQAFQNKGAQFNKVIVTDTNPDVLTKLKSKFPFIQIGNADEASSQEIVFISLHPPVIMDTLETLKSNFKGGSIVVSLAPKISIAKISSKLAQVKNIARLIPNATSYINEGYNSVCFASSFLEPEKKTTMELLGLLGKTFEVNEEKLEGYAMISAMLPTYFWFQWKYLAELGQNFGLSEKESKESINETLIAAINLMYKSGLKPEEVIDLIPVKPIGEHEQEVIEIYKTKLTGLFEKIKP